MAVKKSVDAYKSRLFTTIKYLFLSIMTIVCLYPIYFAVISSFKSTMEIMNSKFALPKHFGIDNYIKAWKIGNMGNYFINSLALTVISMFLLIITGALAAYVISRFKFRFQGLIYTFFISGLMIPMQSTIIPLAFDLGTFGLKNNYPVLTLLFVAFNIPITIFILTAFMKSIPKELEEAAIIDGCSAIQVFMHVIMPMSVPAIVTASVFNFINVWNNLLFPLVFISDKNKQVISFGLLSFFSEWQSDYGGVMAAITLAIIPPFIAYIFLQKKVEQGLTAGAVKG